MQTKVSVNDLKVLMRIRYGCSMIRMDLFDKLSSDKVSNKSKIKLELSSFVKNMNAYLAEIKQSILSEDDLNQILEVLFPSSPTAINFSKDCHAMISKRDVQTILLIEGDIFGSKINSKLTCSIPYGR